MYQLRGKNLADSIAIYGRGREIFRPPMYYIINFQICIGNSFYGHKIMEVTKGLTGYTDERTRNTYRILEVQPLTKWPSKRPEKDHNITIVQL